MSCPAPYYGTTASERTPPPICRRAVKERIANLVCQLFSDETPSANADVTELNRRAIALLEFDNPGSQSFLYQPQPVPVTPAMHRV